MSSVPKAADFTDWLHNLTADYSKLNDEEKNAVLDALILTSGPSQLFALSNKLPHLIFRDFITFLPLEIVIGILQYLDGKQVLLCCQVCKSWNERISGLTSLWRHLAQDAGAAVEELDITLLYSPHEDHLPMDQGQEVKPFRGHLYKQVYLHTLAAFQGFSTGRSINIQKEFIDKGAWRITSVRYFYGNIVTGCDDHTVQIWSVPSGAIINSISTHSVCHLTLTDTHLYTASFNANAESWDLDTGQHCRTFCGHTSAVLAIDVSSDESFLLTGSVDKTAKLWDLRQTPPRLVRTFSDVHEDWVFQVKFLPSDGDNLWCVTCDSTVCYLWHVESNGDLITSYHVKTENGSKFTSFYHWPKDCCQMFTCQWEEGSKTSWLCRYSIKRRTCTVEKDTCVHIPLETVKAYLLGAGQKFAVIMCSISRKDFFVIDIPRKTVVATIVTSDFCMLTRNGSTVTLCDTSWLDGFNFLNVTSDTPVFAAGVGGTVVILGTWAKHLTKADWMKKEKGISSFPRDV